MSPARLDAELVRRGLARSRGRAAELVADGRVSVDGTVVTKASRQVGDDDAVTVDSDGGHYVSRGAHKLLGALDDLRALGVGPQLAGARCLDAGASTGGFTQVLLERGAAHVLAVDVGHGQLHPDVASHPRVSVREGWNVRELSPAQVPEPVDLVVGDLSFISLTLVLEPLVRVTAPGGSLILLVKPQFEVGRGRTVDGVVTAPELRVEAVRAVADAVPTGARVAAVLPSRQPGSAGNVECFLWLARTDGAEEAAGDAARAAVAEAVTAAVEAGRPQLVAVERRPRRQA